MDKGSSGKRHLGAWIAGEAQGPNRQAVQMETDCLQFNPVASKHFTSVDSLQPEAIQVVRVLSEPEGPAAPPAG